METYLPAVLVVAAAAVHLAGERRVSVRAARRRDRRARARALAFYAGLLAILVALTGPLGMLADTLFWVHMIQHLLLLVVAAPLIVLGRPWMSLGRPFPLRMRRAVGQALVRSPLLAPARWLFRVLTRPPGAWLGFTIVLVCWHLPGPYDLTLHSTGVHILEHTTFLIAGILFWAQVIAPSRAARLAPHAGRIAYVAAAVVVNVGLSMFLAFAQHPLYSPYAGLAHRPGGIPALADQQIGAGIMWTAGDLPFGIAVAVLVQGWLAAHEAGASQLAGRDTGPPDGTRAPVADEGLVPPR